MQLHRRRRQADRVVPQRRHEVMPPQDIVQLELHLERVIDPDPAHRFVVLELQIDLLEGRFVQLLQIEILEIFGDLSLHKVAGRSDRPGERSHGPYLGHPAKPPTRLGSSIQPPLSPSGGAAIAHKKAAAASFSAAAASQKRLIR